MRLPGNIKVFAEGKLHQVFSYHILIKRSLILISIILLLILFIRYQYNQPPGKISPPQMSAPALNAPYNLLPLILKNGLLLLAFTGQL